MKKLPVLFPPLTAFGQKVMVETNPVRPKEILLTRPTLSAKPEPILAENDAYRFTPFRRVEWTDAAAGETVPLNQCININNGVVGLFGDDIAQAIPDAVGNADSKFDFWAVLPSMTQRMFVNSKDLGPATGRPNPSTENQVNTPAMIPGPD